MKNETEEAYFEKWVHDIQTEMKEATKRWLRIGDLLEKASVDGIRGKALKRVCGRVGISYPTATKLIKIATSPRIKMYADQLASIDGWSPLYEIVLLNPAEFDDFKRAKLDGGGLVSAPRAEVSKFRRKKTRSKPQELFSIALEVDAVLTITERELLVRIWNNLEYGFAKKLRLNQREGMTQILEEVPLCQAA